MSNNNDVVGVSLVVNNTFRNLVIPLTLVMPLATKLRREGTYPVTITNDKGEMEILDVQGMFIPAKGQKFTVMIFEDKDE